MRKKVRCSSTLIVAAAVVPRCYFSSILIVASVWLLVLPAQALVGPASLVRPALASLATSRHCLCRSCVTILPRSQALRTLSAQAGSSERTSEEPMTVKHLPLQRVFSKTYGENIFSITKNVRQYEWTKDEVETIFADFQESMELPEEQWNDYELGQVVVIHSALKFETSLPTVPQACLEVSDGQQRLVTLCLLYAAIREEMPQDLQKYVQDIPIVKDLKKPPLPRLTLRKNDNKWFQRILEGDCLDDMPTKEAAIKKL